MMRKENAQFDSFKHAEMSVLMFGHSPTPPRPASVKTFCWLNANLPSGPFPVFTENGSLFRAAKVVEDYECETEEPAVQVTDRAFLGRTEGKLHLWESESTLQWTARRDGFPSAWHARTVAAAAYAAAREWNAVLDGRVTFRYVERFDGACFQIEYGGPNGDVFARAFSPADGSSTTPNAIRVFSKCFDYFELPYLRSVFLHELGHVLGLRHEHAQDGFPGVLSAEDMEGGPESVAWGGRNPMSIMAYYRGGTIQESDAEAVRSAYDQLEDGMVLEGEGRSGLVRKTVKRVRPNN